MPGRAIGVQWFAVDRATRTLGMDMTLPAGDRPNTTLRVPVKLGRAHARRGRAHRRRRGRCRHSQSHQLQAAGAGRVLSSASAALSAEVRDLYGQLIDGMQGTRGQIRTGGDDGGGALKARRRRRRRWRSIPAS
jgi:alpha-2-macroglobulin